MLKKINNTLDGSDEEVQTGGEAMDTSRDGRASPDSQSRHRTNRGEEVNGESVEQTDSSIDIDQVFEILKNQRRRYVLKYLGTVDDQVRLGELAEQIAAWEQDKEIRQITSKERKRVYVGLYQCHLPKMDDIGAVSYNKPRGKIGPGENIELFEQYLPVKHHGPEKSSTVRWITGNIWPFSEQH